MTATKTKRRLYRVKYLYRVHVPGSIMHGTTRTAKLTVEVIHAFAACAVGEAQASRACKTAGDERFVRVLSVKEIGEVSRG